MAKMVKIIPKNDFLFFKKVVKKKEGFDSGDEPKPHDAKMYKVIHSTDKCWEGKYVIIKDCIRARMPVDVSSDELWCCQSIHVMAIVEMEE